MSLASRSYGSIPYTRYASSYQTSLPAPTPYKSPACVRAGVTARSVRGHAAVVGASGALDEGQAAVLARAAAAKERLSAQLALLDAGQVPVGTIASGADKSRAVTRKPAPATRPVSAGVWVDLPQGERLDRRKAQREARARAWTAHMRQYGGSRSAQRSGGGGGGVVPELLDALELVGDHGPPAAAGAAADGACAGRSASAGRGRMRGLDAAGHAELKSYMERKRAEV